MTRSISRTCRAHIGPSTAFLDKIEQVCGGYCFCMLKKVEIEIDDDLVQEAIRRYHVADAREAIHLALRMLLDGNADAGGEQADIYDEFSDLRAWQRRRNGDPG